MPRRVLITGGAGFIGSHTALVLLEQGYQLVGLEMILLSEVVHQMKLFIIWMELKSQILIILVLREVQEVQLEWLMFHL